MDNSLNELRIKIIDWNLERGFLEEGFDPKPELCALSNKARDFYIATSLEQQLIEYADFLFIQFGTVAKYYSNTFKSPGAFCISRQQWKEFIEWIKEVEVEMYDILQMKFDLSYRQNLKECIIAALRTVINNNSDTVEL